MNFLNSINFLELTLIFLLFILCAIILKYVNALKLSNRITKYTVNKNKKAFPSIGDNIVNILLGIIKSISMLISKSKLFKKSIKKYDTYLKIVPIKNINSIDIITIKILSGIILTIFFIIIIGLKDLILSDFGLIFLLITGYYLPNLYFIYFTNQAKKSIKKELLTAIILMNNAFKAGRSTHQALEDTLKQIKGPLKEEIETIINDLKMGLSIGEAFARFASRTKLEEAKYIASTITIGEITGGNIIKVFSSIEKSIFNKKTIEKEINTLTASSKITIKAMTILPIIFIGIIYLISPDYFDPFFNNIIGNIIFIIIILMVIIYTYLTIKILRIEE